MGREVAREVEFGEKSCFANSSFERDIGKNEEEYDCTGFKNETICAAESHCYWEFSGLGIQYQVLAGPAFILVFIFSAVLLAVLSDWLAARLSRTLMLAGGTLTFSLACLFMGLSTQYWHLVILRLVTNIIFLIAIISIAPSNDGKYQN